MNNLLIYYGWLNSFNSATNSWNNEKVAQELARYNLLVFGDGIQLSSHGDYSNSQVIIPRIQELNANAKVFGYVTVNQTYANFKTKVDNWITLGVDGIFFDEAGYDYGTVSTNSRTNFNDKVDYVHSNDLICFINAWNPDHVIGTENDVSYPNSSWNPDMLESNLCMSDWYLHESFAINSSGNYEVKSQWKSRGDKAQKLGLNIAACSVISDTDQSGQAKFDFIYTSALMFNMDALGSSDTLYGASSAKSKMWDRPDYSKIDYDPCDDANVKVDVNDSDVYLRYCDFGILKVDFSSGAQTSSITDYEA